MILSVAIVTGFKKEIRQKIIGFGSHIQIVNYDNNNTFETKPINKNQPFIAALKKEEDIKHIEAFATKPGIIQTDSDIQGVVLKGIGPDFDWTFIKDHLKEGKIITINDSVKSDQAMISQYLASLLKLKVGDHFRMFFAQNPPRMRKFVISGIYSTDLIEFDKVYIFVDITQIQKLNGWSSNQVSGLEITLNDFNKLDEATEKLWDIVGNNYSKKDTTLRVENVREKNVQIFDWLNLQDMNVWVILILMLVVSGFNMVSGLLILILERTNMIGILKALGSRNILIRRIFLYQAGFLILKGLFWGNLLGLAICLIQKYTGIIKLDPTSYFLDRVPINLNLLYWVGLNLGTLIITILMLIIPSFIISNISPDKTIKYE